jgi:Phasin protein
MVALGIWSPWLVGAANWNAQVLEGFGTIASEWQNFVSRRLKEDFAFMQRAAQCRTPDQMAAAHADFWRTAMEDYSKEYMLMGKLAAGVTTKAAAVAQSATHEASVEVLPSLKAA